MSCFLIARTDRALMDVFGISYNTWCKIERGLPIRTSLIQRIEDRMRRLEGGPERQPRALAGEYGSVL